MKKVITATLVIMALSVGSAFAQWSFESHFPDTSFQGSGHGLAVDPDGKIWFQHYYNTDSILTAAGTYAACRRINVFNSDGTPAAFNGLKMITVGGVTDTLWNSQKGLGLDIDGNILYAVWETVYRINYQTGEGMNSYHDAAGSMTAPSCDDFGNIIVGPVLPGNPIYMLDPDFNFIGNVVDGTEGYARTSEVSPDGNTVYWLPFTAPNVLYNRPDEFSAFVVADTNWMPGFQPESSEWHPVTGDLWLSAGSFNNPGVGYTNNTWYAIDVATSTLTDSLKWVFDTPDNAAERPRAIAFTADGNTCYVTVFGGGGYPSIEKFVRGSTGVGWEHVGVIDGYTLSQNYPNPFNPSTTIQFSIARDGLTTLKVYDMLGRTVATLVNEKLTMGIHTIEFDGSRLPSGIYIYEMVSGNRRITKKLTLTK